MACLLLTPVQMGWPLHLAKNSWGATNFLNAVRLFPNPVVWSGTFKTSTPDMILKAHSFAQSKAASSGAQSVKIIKHTSCPCMISLLFRAPCSPAEHHSSHRLRWRNTCGVTCLLTAFSVSLSLKMWRTWMTTCWSTATYQLALKVNRLEGVGNVLYKCKNPVHL